MRSSFTLSVKEEILFSKNKNKKLFLLWIINISSKKMDNKYSLRINDEEFRQEINIQIKKYLKINSEVVNKEINIENNQRLGNLLNELNHDIENIDEKWTYLSSMFFTRGYISSPKSKYYHLEITVKKVIDAINITNLLISIGINAKFQSKGKQYRIYIKNPGNISDFLFGIGANNYSLLYINQKIERDFAATISRQNAIDLTNQEKIAECSVRQQRYCKRALTDLIKYKISVKEKRISKLRIKYPEYSSQDLAFKYNEKYFENKSKSTINRWLNNVCKIVKEEDNE